MNMIFSVLGLIGGLLCAAADIFLDYKGKDNKEMGKYGLVNSKWETMSGWRFKVSILIAMVAVPMYGLGVFSLADQIGTYNKPLSVFLQFAGYVGIMGGFFIHAFLCLLPVIYQAVRKKGSFELGDEIVSAAFQAVMIPFYVFYLIIGVVPAAVVVYCIIVGYLSVPMWFVLLNPTVFFIIGILLRALKRDWFCDLPGICMPSLGMGMFGIVGIVNLLG